MSDYPLCPEVGILPGSAQITVNKYLDFTQFTDELKAALGVTGSLPMVATVEGGSYAGDNDFTAHPATLFVGPIESPWPLDPAVVEPVIAAHVPQRHWGFTDDQKYLHDIQVKTNHGIALSAQEQGDQIRALMSYATGGLPQCTCTTPLVG